VAFVWALLSGAAAAQPALERLTIVAPAAPGGGWDQTARAMQHALTATGLVRVVQVENVPGAAGTIGLAQFINGHTGEDDTLLVTGLVMVGAIVFNRSPVSLARATPIARLTGEYEVLAVPAASPVRSTRDLLERLASNPASVSWGGGSAGGTDHILAGSIAAAAGVDPRRVNYIAFSGGGEAVSALLGSQVTVGVSGYSEFAPHIQSGRLRALAITSPSRIRGIDAPTLIEDGVDVTLANWRGLVAPPGIGDQARRRLVDMVDRMVHSAVWQQTLGQREWTDLWMAGEPFSRFLDDERVRVTRIASRLRADATDPALAGTGARVFPATILSGGATVALLLGWQIVRRRATRPDRTGGERAHDGVSARPASRAGAGAPWWRRASAAQTVRARALTWIAAGLAAHLLLLTTAGFVVASTALFWCAAIAFGSRRPLRHLAVAAIFATVVYLAFTRGLDLALPAGVLGGWAR
jgi:putative tricarboxylic transport membrane protein